ncbi:MAG: CBS domain-containing protein [Saprospirales bacterium]|nr:CBS domain-containing protein [Saprospirales bacterium]
MLDLVMTAESLIAYDIPALQTEQTGKDAFHALNDHHVKHLPVVDAERQLVGILSEEDIFNHKLYEPIGEYNFSTLRRFAVRHTDHVFEVMRIMGENRLTVIPVVDEQGNYLGLIAQNDLLRYFANAASFTEPGGVLVLEMNRRDYSLGAIARIVEEEDAKILSTFVTSGASAETIELTIKVNRQELGRIVASLERYEYDVKETFAELDYADALQERYDSLMNYLNI